MLQIVRHLMMYNLLIEQASQPQVLYYTKYFYFKYYFFWQFIYHPECNPDGWLMVEKCNTRTIEFWFWIIQPLQRLNFFVLHANARMSQFLAPGNREVFCLQALQIRTFYAGVHFCTDSMDKTSNFLSKNLINFIPS